MDNEYKNEPFHDEDDYSLIKNDQTSMSAVDDSLPTKIKKQARKKAKLTSQNDASTKTVGDSVPDDLSTVNMKKRGNAKKQLSEKASDLTNDYNLDETIEKTVSGQDMITSVGSVKLNPPPTTHKKEVKQIKKIYLKKTLDEHANRPSFDEYTDYMTAQETLSIPKTSPTDHFINQEEKIKSAEENQIIDSVKISPLEKIREKVQAFAASKSSNWFFAVSLVLVIGIFIVFKIHRFSSVHSQTNAHPASNSSSFSSLNQPVSRTTQTNRNNIAVAGEGVIPDDNGFATSDEVTPPVTTSATPSNNMGQDKIADLTHKIDLANNKLDAIQASIENIQMKLSPAATVKPIPVKVLGVLQNQRDDKWHADVLVKGQVFDVVTGDTVGGVHIESVSGNGVDYQNAP